MSRNRKHQAAAVRFGPALKALGLCLFLGGSGVGYVWQKEQIVTLSDRYKQAEEKYMKLRKNNDRLAKVLAALQTPGELEAAIRRLDLGLVPAQPHQVVHLTDAPTGSETWPNQEEPLYAQHAPPASPAR